MQVQKIISSVNGYTTGVVKNDADRFFVASKKATTKEVETALDKLVKYDSIPDCRFFYLPNLIGLNGMDIAVVSKTVEDSGYKYTRVFPKSTIKLAKYGDWKGTLSSIRKVNKDTGKGVTFLVKRKTKPDLYSSCDWTTHSSGATEKEIQNLESRVVGNNLF